MRKVHSPNTIDGVQVINDEYEALKHLLKGEEVMRFEYGDSMKPILVSGEYARLKPIKKLNEVKIGDAVFCKVNNHLMTHMVSGILLSNGFNSKKHYIIASSKGNIFGVAQQIYAKAYSTKVIESSDES